MSKLRGLIVGKADTTRSTLSAILNSDNDIDIVAYADSGSEALVEIKKIKPDFLIIDMRLPNHDAIEAIAHIMSNHPLPILVIADLEKSQSAFDALSQGALEVIPVSGINRRNSDSLIRKVKLLAKIKVIRHIRNRPKTGEYPILVLDEAIQRPFANVVAIASSTGGPKALAKLLAVLPQDFPCPIVIAQHIDNSFVNSLVDWIDGVSPLNVRIGCNGDILESGTIYISPANKNMVIGQAGKISLEHSDKSDVYHPSCDKLLTSAASIFGSCVIGIILTGMGHDGVMGMKDIKCHGGTTIAQDEKSSIVFGMPKVAIDAGCIDRILSIGDIAPYLRSLVDRSATLCARDIS